jgi:hypothetical protein
VDHRYRHHVLNAVIAVGRIGERSLLVDDPDRRLVRADRDAADVGEPVADQRVQLHCTLDGGLGVEFGLES